MKRPGGFDGPVRRGPGDEPRPPVALPPLFSAEGAEGRGGDPVLAEDPAATAVLTPLPERGAVALEDRETGAGGIREARGRLRRAGRERRGRERREQRRFTAHRRRRRRNWLIATAAVLGLALFVAAGVFTPIMAVRDIQVRGAETVNVEELRLALSKLEGVPLALVQDSEVRKVLEPFPIVQRYAVERIPPGTLLVRIEERSPAIALQRSGGYELLDPAGIVLARVDAPPAGVPVGSTELNDTSSAAFRAAATIVRDMPEDLRAVLAEVRATNAQDVTFVLTTGTEIVWGEASDTQRKALVLKSLIAAAGLGTMIDVSAPEAPVFR